MDLSQGLGRIGGEWTAECRTLKVEAGGWLDSQRLSRYLQRCWSAAAKAEDEPSVGNLVLLQEAVEKLEKEVRQYAYDLTRFQAKVGEFVAEVVKARAEFVPPVEPERRDLLGDDDVIDRLGEFYGIPKPKRRR